MRSREGVRSPRGQPLQRFPAVTLQNEFRQRSSATASRGGFRGVLRSHTDLARDHTGIACCHSRQQPVDTRMRGLSVTDSIVLVHSKSSSRRYFDAYFK